MRQLTLEGKCDKTAYPIEIEKEQIHAVNYRDMTVPKPYGNTSVTSAITSYRVNPNATLLNVSDPLALVPDSEIAAFWFVRSAYESFRRPVYYLYKPTNTLIVFPPVSNDGDLILVSVKPQEVEVYPDSILAVA